MTHFAVVVLANLDGDSVQAEVERLLRPYDENIQVEPYAEPCGCVGHHARMRVLEAANATDFLETRDGLRAEFSALRTDARAREPRYGEVGHLWCRVGEEFDHVIEVVGATPVLLELRERERDAAARWTAAHEEREALIERLTAEQPDVDAPDPECGECGGSGASESTYNPLSEWDWWQIGGRWTGYFTDYDPDTDPENFEQCSICGGTGRRTDAIARANGMVGCNGCEGIGVRKKWPTGWRSEGNVCSAAAFLEQLKADAAATPYALVTPDGKWHSKGKMGWFGMSDDRLEADEWREHLLGLLTANIHATAVAVDCHI